MRQRMRFAVLGVFVAVGLLAATGCQRQEPSGEAQATASEAKNTPEKQYVGDASCASCHSETYESYHKTGMGRSLTRFDAQSAPEQFASEAVYHEASDFYYKAFTRGDTLYQREFRLGSEGDTTYKRTEKARWVVGSGNATRSYLTETNGYVMEMPLTWYVEREKWDMSPGYKQVNQRFSRSINEECMTCHNGYAEFSTFSQNHFKTGDMPLGITCERCHGPGSEHVERRLAGLGPPEGEPDTTIVNPANLSRSRRLDVCQQCHLTGQTVLKPGETMQSFRPGEELSAHRAVFVPQRNLEDPRRFGIASHALRLEKSACFKHSDMTCTTCHDPHEPVGEQALKQFNETCKSCHTPSADQPVCGRPGAHEDIDAAMTGNCVSCHMQKGGTSDIPHVTFTDHWIRRDPPENVAASERAGQGVIEEVGNRKLDLVRVTDDAPGQAQAKLERAVAYFKFYETKHRRPGYLPEVTRKAREGLQGGAETSKGRLTLGRALLEQDSLRAAERVLQAAAKAHPDHARIQYWLGVARLRQGQNKAAVGPLKEAWNAQSALTEAGMKLGEALSGAGRTQPALRAYREVVRRNPAQHPEAWNNLGFIYLQQRDLDKALNHFQRALALRPDLAQALVNAGTVHLMRREMAEARRYFERSIEADPDYTPAYGNLAMIYARNGKTGEARRLLQELLKRNPNDRRARSLLQRLDRMESSSSANAPNR